MKKFIVARGAVWVTVYASSKAEARGQATLMSGLDMSKAEAWQVAQLPAEEKGNK